MYTMCASFFVLVRLKKHKMIEKSFDGDSMKKDKKKKTEAIVDNLCLPKDLLLGCVILNITGRNEAYVENYKGIIEYNANCIRLQTKSCQVFIYGENLFIEYYTNDEMKITGCFCEIKYC